MYETFNKFEIFSFRSANSTRSLEKFFKYRPSVLHYEKQSGIGEDQSGSFLRDYLAGDGLND